MKRKKDSEEEERTPYAFVYYLLFAGVVVLGFLVASGNVHEEKVEQVLGIGLMMAGAAIAILPNVINEIRR